MFVPAKDQQTAISKKAVPITSKLGSVTARSCDEIGLVLLGAFSEIELDILEVIAESDKVLVHLRFRGVYSGAFGDYEATGKRFDVMVLDFFRIDNGMIAEQWSAIDNLGLQRQIGMI